MKREHSNFTKVHLLCIGVFIFTTNAKWKILNYKWC